MTRKTVAVTVGLLLLSPLCFARAKNKDEKPVVWGVLSQNTGCVIFREHRKTRGMFWGVAVTAVRFSELDVVDSENYKLPGTSYRETQANMDMLERLANKNRLKYVNIPGKVTPAQLKAARALCKSSSASPDVQ